MWNGFNFLLQMGKLGNRFDIIKEICQYARDDFYEIWQSTPQ